MAKCPHCGSNVGGVTITGITASTLRTSWKAVAYSCTACQSVLSVGIDPVALKTDTITGVVKALKGR